MCQTAWAGWRMASWIGSLGGPLRLENIQELVLRILDFLYWDFEGHCHVVIQASPGAVPGHPQEREWAE